MISTTLVRYVLTAAIRDRLLTAAALVLILSISLSIFLGSAAIVEQDQFALVFAAGGMRLALILALVLFTVFHIRRSFDSKDVEFLLSRPIGRVPFILSHALAFSLLALVFSILTGSALIAMAPQHLSGGHLLWSITMAMETIIMVNVAMFFSMVITSAVGASMAVLGFYVLARMMGQILGIINAGTVETLQILELAMQVISMLMPRLDLMGQTGWLIYGADSGSHMLIIAIQAVVFTGLIIIAALIDFLKRQF